MLCIYTLCHNITQHKAHQFVYKFSMSGVGKLNNGKGGGMRGPPPKKKNQPQNTYLFYCKKFKNLTTYTSLKL